MSYRHHSFPYLLYAWKKKITSWYVQVGYHCKWFSTSVGASKSSVEVILPRRFQREKEAMWASLEMSLTHLSICPTLTEDPFDSGRPVPVNYIWNASKAPLWLGRIGIVGWWALCQNPEVSPWALLSISCWHWLCIYGELMAWMWRGILVISWEFPLAVSLGLFIVT